MQLLGIDVGASVGPPRYKARKCAPDCQEPRLRHRSAEERLS
jgi:hypothetical protein